MRNEAILTAALAVALFAGPGQSQKPAADSEKIRQIIVYGTDPCPASPAGEIIVCARRPEAERYRIPHDLRETPSSPESRSWSERAQVLETMGRTGINSCSPVGPGGATGCLTQLIEQARRERRQNAVESGKTP